MRSIVAVIWQQLTNTGTSATLQVFDPVSQTWSEVIPQFPSSSHAQSFAPVWDSAGHLTLADNRVDIQPSVKTVTLDDGTMPGSTRTARSSLPATSVSRLFVSAGSALTARRAADFSLFEAFSLSERVKMQFRAECINVWNHSNLFGPNTSPTTSTFGMITGQDVPRVWLLNLNLRF